MEAPFLDRRRWMAELTAIQKHYPRATLLEDGTLVGTLEISGKPRHFRLRWPPDFPLRPPQVWETDTLAGEAVDHSASGHAYADGALCLFPHGLGKDAWKPEGTAADSLRRFAEYCAAMPQSWIQVGAGILEVGMRVSLSPEMAEGLRNGPRYGTLRFWRGLEGRLFLVTELRLGGKGAPVKSKLEEGWAPALGAMGSIAQAVGLAEGSLLVQDAYWCKVPTHGKPWNTLIQGQNGLENLLGTFGLRKAAQMMQSPLLILVSQENPESRYVVWPNPAHPLLKAFQLPLLSTVPLIEDLPQKLFSRVDGVLRGRGHLKDCTVAMVGLGSLGSQVALALARAGVQKFVLFDPEQLEPENVLRHVGRLSQVGLPKVQVVREEILAINPDALVEEHPVGLSFDQAGWSTDPAGAFQKVLKDPNGIVVCTTAMHDVEGPVNLHCVRAGRPVVFASVLGQAEHARIFRVLPGESPCYQCVLIAQQQDPDRFPRFETGDLRQGAAYHQPGIPGLSLDIGEIAQITARMVMQTLGRALPKLGYPDSHADHLLWSSRGGWVFDGPLQTVAQRVPMNPECPSCARKQDAPLLESEERELRELLEQMTKKPTDPKEGS